MSNAIIWCNARIVHFFHIVAVAKQETTTSLDLNGDFVTRYHIHEKWNIALSIDSRLID